MQRVALLTDTGYRRSLISYPESLLISAWRLSAEAGDRISPGCQRLFTLSRPGRSHRRQGGICFFDALVMLTGGHPWMPAGT